MTLVYSCQKDGTSSDDDGGLPDFVSAKGFGNSDEDPEGTPLLLPPGITLDSPIYTYNRFDETDCGGHAMEGEPGKETLVPLCFAFKNNTNSKISVELPPGLIVVSDNKEVQNGILIEKLTIEVPEGQYLFSPIKAYCLNDTRSIPGVGTDFKYKAEIVTTYQPMLDLLQKLDTKKLTTGNLEQNAVITAKVQSLIWNIENKGKLDAYNQAVFNGLEDKS
ncbi:hypothetical protein LX77_03230 [Gelidibacter algens]|uniref:Uncharacterized protein n=1 Tax=Gelidibacter algens TaxID=49280 RepID=A0A1A7R0T0_9FLAO|nr:hypothetical protein [Gelidibacter algens]OBX25128.1 hypothetical protein A9996_11525 [Gelidibacter algens]RAJ20016.1 hypothetical protein LX77_03230 [Gelidibacter algens]